MSTQATLVGGGNKPAADAAERHPHFYTDEVGDGYKVVRASVLVTDPFIRTLMFLMQVENTLFRFHFAILVSFSKLFVPPNSLGNTTEGATDGNPIVMQGDSALHWEGLIGWASFDM
jgi:hypothetical protein